MDEAVFWRLVGRLGRDPDDTDFAVLAERLAERPEAEITGFADRLASVLWSMDTPAHFASAGSGGDTWFLCARCAVVAAGRRAYEKVLRRSAALERFADSCHAEPLLGLAPAAFESATGQLWEHETPLSHEMGSNTAAWGHPPRSAGRAPRPWLTLQLALGDTVAMPEAFPSLLHEAVDLAGADPAWQRWWAGSGLQECELSLLLDAFVTGPPVFRAGRTRARVDVAHDSGPHPLEDRSALAVHAAVEIQNMLAVARARLGLAELPPLTVPRGEGLAAGSFGAPSRDPEFPSGLLDLFHSPGLSHSPGLEPNPVR